MMDAWQPDQRQTCTSGRTGHWAKSFVVLSVGLLLVAVDMGGLGVKAETASATFPVKKLKTCHLDPRLKPRYGGFLVLFHLTGM